MSLMVRLVRHRTMPRVSRVILAAALAVTAGWLNWRIEWFDVWRFGVPSSAYLKKSFVPGLIASALAGWYLGALVVRRPPAR